MYLGFSRYSDANASEYLENDEEQVIHSLSPYKQFSILRSPLNTFFLSNLHQF